METLSIIDFISENAYCCSLTGCSSKLLLIHQDTFMGSLELPPLREKQCKYVCYNSGTETFSQLKMWSKFESRN